MGRWIDRAAMTALTAAALFLVFSLISGNVTAAYCMTLACSIPLVRIRKKKNNKYRMTRFQAQAILENWAYGSDEDAQTHIQSLLSCGSDSEIIYLPKHPTASISMSDVFSTWKGHRSAEKIILCAVCYSDARARAFASTLQTPSVEITDAARLIPMIRKSSLPPPHVSSARHAACKIKALISELPFRRPWYRSMLAGLGLMLVYLIVGNPAYLALSVSTLFIAGISLRIRT